MIDKKRCIGIRNVLKKQIVLCIVLYSILVIVKSATVILVPSPTIFGDEYGYTRMAGEFFHTLKFTVHGVLTTAYPPLYPLLISPAFVIKDMETVYLVMKIINVLLSTLIIFPAFMLARIFFQKRSSIWIAALVGIAPLSFAAAPYIMSENLFFPLFLLAAYLIIKTRITPAITTAILGGLASALAINTRYLGWVLPFCIAVLIGDAIVHKEKRARNLLLLLLGIASLGGIIWTIRNEVITGNSAIDLVQKSIISSAMTPPLGVAAIFFFIWIAMNIMYTLLAGGIVPILLNGEQWKTRFENKKMRALHLLSITTAMFLIVMLAKRALNLGIKEITVIPGFVGRIIGRYEDMVIPLLLINGLVILKSEEGSLSKKGVIIGTIITIIAAPLWYFPLLPFNNLSLSAWGALKMGSERLLSGGLDPALITLPTLMLMMIAVIAIMWWSWKYLKESKTRFTVLMIGLTIFFAASSILSLTATTINAAAWNQDEQLQIGKWINNYVLQNPDIQRVIIDENACVSKELRANPKSLCTPGGRTTLLGFWINKDIRIAPTEFAQQGDIIISHDGALPDELVYQSASGINVYRR